MWNNTISPHGTFLQSFTAHKLPARPSACVVYKLTGFSQIETIVCVITIMNLSTSIRYITTTSYALTRLLLRLWCRHTSTYNCRRIGMEVLRQDIMPRYKSRQGTITSKRSYRGELVLGQYVTFQPLLGNHLDFICSQDEVYLILFVLLSLAGSVVLGSFRHYMFRSLSKQWDR